MDLHVVEDLRRKGPRTETRVEAVDSETSSSIYRRFMDGRSTWQLSIEFDLRQRAISRIVADEVEKARTKAFMDGFRRGKLSVTPPRPPAKAA